MPRSSLVRARRVVWVRTVTKIMTGNLAGNSASNLSSDSGRAFEWPLRVYIEDTDAGGIVYYVNYLKFMERGRTEMFRGLALTASGLFSDELMFVVHSLQSDYRAPAILDDRLLVSTRVLQCGKAFVLLEQNIYRLQAGTDGSEKINDNRELLCRGEVKIACVRRDTLRPRRLPADIYSALNNVSL